MPAPFGPMMPSHSPDATRSLIPASATAAPYRTVTWSKTITTGPAWPGGNGVMRRPREERDAPASAVITPIGTSAGDCTVRAAMSASTRNAAPPIIDTGSTIR